MRSLPSLLIAESSTCVGITTGRECRSIGSEYDDSRQADGLPGPIPFRMKRIIRYCFVHSLQCISEKGFEDGKS